MRRLCLVVAYVSSLGAVAACSLLVDTKGLSGSAAIDAATPIVDGATTPLAEAGPQDGGPLPEGAAPSCEGGTTLSSFDGFMPVGNVVVTPSTVTAVVSTSAVGGQSASLARRDFEPAPSRLHLAYDLTLTRSDVLYFEPGCGVYLQNDDNLNMLQTFFSDQGSLGQALNIFQSDGGQEQRQRRFLDLPASGPSTHHVELELTRSDATDATISVTVDGINQTDNVVLPKLSVAFFLRCGVIYADRYSSGGGMESKNVTITNPSVTICP